MTLDEALVWSDKFAESLTPTTSTVTAFTLAAEVRRLQAEIETLAGVGNRRNRAGDGRGIQGVGQCAYGGGGMSDRELLELAAKACGYDTLHKWNAYRLTLTPPVIALCIPEVSTGWNPLDDGGDALKLAVVLKIGVHPDILEDDLCATSAKVFGRRACVEKHGQDQCAATRRAIVRAAAEIGKVAR